MKVERQFFKCQVCGNIVSLIESGGGTLSCCGQPMQLLTSNTEDAAVEKHVPAVTVDGNLVVVKVGEVPHPQTKEHHISFIALAQGAQTQIAKLSPEGAPETIFHAGEGDMTVYAECNLHGLWAVDIDKPFVLDGEICSAEFSAGCQDSNA